VLLASTRRISALLPPYSQVPGPSADGGGARVECEKLLTMSMALKGALTDRSSKAGETRMG
jgi:hypothetical protein